MKKTIFWIMAVFVISLAMSNCGLHEQPIEGGAIRIRIDSTIAKNILPPLSMVCTSYDIHGTSATDSFDVLDVSGDVLVEGLIEETYTVTVIGKNDTALPIGEGVNAVMVILGATVPCPVSVLEYAGLGSLDLEVNWQPDILVVPTVDAKLIDGAAVETPLAFGVDGGIQQATYLGDHSNGFYSLIFKLLDSGELAGGFADVVRIVKDQVSAAIIAVDVNPAFGSIDILITSAIEDFLILDSTVPEGEIALCIDEVTPFDITASGASLFVWYLNGEQVASGTDTFTVDPTAYNLGEYSRLDVIGWNVSGTAAGSLSWNLVKNELHLSQFDLEGTIYFTDQVNTCYIRLLLDGSVYRAIEVTGIFDPPYPWEMLDIEPGEYTLEANIVTYEQDLGIVEIPHPVGATYNFTNFMLP